MGENHPQSEAQVVSHGIEVREKASACSMKGRKIIGTQ
jgi:hypothetical protein